MHPGIKAAFASLASEREKITRVLNDKGDIATKRLKWWPLFNAACVIAEHYPSDVRKKLRLDIAAGYLTDAKGEMSQYGISQDDFLTIEKNLKAVIDIISTLNLGHYKQRISEIKQHAVEDVMAPTLKK